MDVHPTSLHAPCSFPLPQRHRPESASKRFSPGSIWRMGPRVPACSRCPADLASLDIEMASRNLERGEAKLRGKTWLAAPGQELQGHRLPAATRLSASSNKDAVYCLLEKPFRGLWPGALNSIATSCGPCRALYPTPAMRERRIPCYVHLAP